MDTILAYLLLLGLWLCQGNNYVLPQADDAPLAVATYLEFILCLES